MRYNFINMTGKKFGRLTVLKRGDDVKGRVQWTCRCDCGEEGDHNGTDLRLGLAKSCGCLFKDLKRESNKKNINPNTPINTLFCNYKAGANSRSINFDLSLEDFGRLVSQKCFYCGADPEQLLKTKYHEFRHNGIDRMDSTLGYVVGNTVTCCGRCNYAKASMSIKEFCQWIEKLYTNLNATGRA